MKVVLYSLSQLTSWLVTLGSLQVRNYFSPLQQIHILEQLFRESFFYSSQSEPNHYLLLKFVRHRLTPHTFVFQGLCLSLYLLWDRLATEFFSWGHRCGDATFQDAHFFGLLAEYSKSGNLHDFFGIYYKCTLYYTLYLEHIESLFIRYV